MKRILMIAQPWGYGPVGSLMNCRSRLAGAPAVWRYLGPAYTAGVVDPNLFETCTFFESGSNFGGPALQRALAWADVVVSGTEFRVAAALPSPPPRLVVIDPLFWFWPAVPPLVVAGMVYLCPNFPGVIERVGSLPAEIRSSFHVVAPALPIVPGRVSPQPAHPQSGSPLPPGWAGAGDFAPRPARGLGAGGLVVNLGGVVNPVVSETDHPELVLEALLPVLGGRPCTITGNAAVLARLEARWPQQNLTFRCLNYAEMLACVAAAGFFLTIPGLNSTLEAFGLGVPVGFLPPQNGSQAAQLACFQQARLGGEGLDWGALLGSAITWNTRDELDNNRNLAECAAACRASAGGMERLRAALARQLDLSASGQAELCTRQAVFLQALGAGAGISTLEAVFERMVFAKP